MNLTRDKLNRAFDYLCKNMCEEEKCYSGCPLFNINSRHSMLIAEVVTRVENIISATNKGNSTSVAMLKSALCNNSSCDFDRCDKCVLGAARRDQLYALMKKYLVKTKRNLI